MKVVLFALNGSWGHTNLAVRCLRPPLEREGHTVILREYSLKDRTSHILETLYNDHADVYGFSCYIWNLEETLKIANTVRSLLPKSRIVLGGPEVSFDTDRFDGMEWIDAIVMGEGEAAFSRLCDCFANGKPFPRLIPCETPTEMAREGILYRADEQTGEILYYESSRGCPFGCAYCLSSATGGRVRFKSVEETLCDLEKFEHLTGKCKVIKLVDRTFNANPKRSNEIWRALLEDRFTKCYHFEICASLLDEESYEILSRFQKGKVRLEIGLQSTNEETLDAVARHLSAERTLAATKRLHEMKNLHVHLDLIAGLPYETYESFARSFDAAYGSCDVLQLGFLKLLHGTPLRRDAEKYGYVSLPTPPYTVLESKWIAYGEMQSLFHIAEVLERYHESGRFVHALWYLDSLMPSPFAFWEGFAKHLMQTDSRPLQRISQPDAFRYLLQYAREALPTVDEDRLKELLCADFSQHENKNPPCFLRRENQ